MNCLKTVPILVERSRENGLRPKSEGCSFTSPKGPEAEMGRQLGERMSRSTQILNMLLGVPFNSKPLVLRHRRSLIWDDEEI